eukprot:gnl/TRDRNA2_/TRDRNA2_144594_c0_seq1.p1 gnl/TRDRNA2_/TRDRNA2_144594_c0~~gnl/TRDRNA2_/TRDRNA2_144594_c0_seq1.p1  ORF type:complete len:434 (-),score=44.63 gnl/TRDRNA2_/TRDRNA2_144594_c0_seq1:33-1196(-)
MALEEITSMRGMNYPLIDVEGFFPEDLEVLLSPASHGRKVEVILQWIQGGICRAMDEGVLSVPPPILSRVFQQLKDGFLAYRQLQQVSIWPFPFPYAQLNWVLISMHMAATPVVMCSWTTDPSSCAIFTFLGIVVMLGLDMIGIELENPWGDDPNDLPAFALQNAMNLDLLLLANPKVCETCPKLRPSAVTEYDKLEAACKTHLESLQTHNQRVHPVLGRGKKLEKMEQWASQTWEIKHSALDSIVDKLDLAVARGEEGLVRVSNSFRESPTRQVSPPTVEKSGFDAVPDTEGPGAGSTASLIHPSPREQANSSCPDTNAAPVTSSNAQSQPRPPLHEAPGQDLSWHLRQHVELPLHEVSSQLAQLTQTSEKQLGLLAQLVQQQYAI